MQRYTETLYSLFLLAKFNPNHDEQFIESQGVHGKKSCSFRWFILHLENAATSGERCNYFKFTASRLPSFHLISFQTYWSFEVIKSTNGNFNFIQNRQRLKSCSFRWFIFHLENAATSGERCNYFKFTASRLPSFHLISLQTYCNFEVIKSTNGNFNLIQNR